MHPNPASRIVKIWWFALAICLLGGIGAAFAAETYWGCYNCVVSLAPGNAGQSWCRFAANNGTGYTYCTQDIEFLTGFATCGVTGDRCLNTDVFGGGGGGGVGGGGGTGGCTRPPGGWCPASCATCTTAYY